MNAPKAYKSHLFVCTTCSYKEKNGEDCPPDTAANWRKELKKKAKERYPDETEKSLVRINASGCLGECENGIAAVIYPKGQWLLGLRPCDSDKIWQAINDNLNKA